MVIFLSANKLPSYLPTELPGVKNFGGRKVTKFQSYRATYLPSYPHKKIPAKEKFPSYQATYLLSYRVTDTENKYQRKIKTTEYQINKLPSYLPTELPLSNFFPAEKKLPSYLPTELPAACLEWWDKRSYQATYLLSYRHGKIFRLTKKVTKLPTY